MAKKRKYVPSWVTRKPKKVHPQVDHTKSFIEQVEELQQYIDRNKPRKIVVADEIILSNVEIRKVTIAWLYEKDLVRRRRLTVLMLLGIDGNVKRLAGLLEITLEEIISALEEL